MSIKELLGCVCAGVGKTGPPMQTEALHFWKQNWEFLVHLVCVAALKTNVALRIYVFSQA